MANNTSTTSSEQTVTVYMAIKDAARAIDFYKKAFGATEVYRLTGPGENIAHAEITIGNSKIMLSDEHPDWGALGPQSIGGTPITLNIAVSDADKAVEQAVKAGGTLARPVSDQFYGYRAGMVQDPFGYKWHIAAKLEEVSPEEMQRRFQSMFEKHQTAQQ